MRLPEPGLRRKRAMAAVPDHTLRQAALYADAVPQMALVKRRGMLPVQVLLQRYLERHIGVWDESCGPCWSSPRELLKDLEEVWDRMQRVHRRRRWYIQFCHRGIFQGHNNNKLHIMYRLPLLTTRIWRRQHRQVMALIY